MPKLPFNRLNTVKVANVAFAAPKPATAVATELIKPATLVAAVAAQPAPPKPKPAGMTMLAAGHLFQGQLAATTGVKPVVATTFSPKIDRMLFLRPELIKVVGNIQPKPGVPRTQVSVPVCPQASLSDTVLYEAANDPSQKFYLARYKLAIEKVSGIDRLRVSMSQTAEGSTLTVFLDKFAAPELVDSLGGAQEFMPEQMAVFLRRKLLINNQAAGDKELLFDQIHAEPNGIRAVLIMETPSEANDIFLALTNTDFQASLTVRRVITAALPVQSGNETLYRTQQQPLDYTLDEPNPFVFAPEINTHVFGDIRPDPNQRFGLLRRVVDGKTYFQDERQPYLFYFLPDSFKITRTPNPPFLPMVAVRFSATDGAPEDIQATMEFIAVPVIDARRLERAAEGLRAFLPPSLPPGISGAIFDSLPAGNDQVTLRLALPLADGSASGLQDCPDAAIDLDRSITYFVTRPLGAFQTLFDALLGGSSLLMNGEVVINLPGIPQEKIPFIGRLNDLAGELFEYTETPDASGSSLSATLRNACESPLRMESLSAQLVRGAGRAAATLVGLSLPLELKPGEQTTFQVAAAQPLDGGEGVLDAVFDLDGVRSLPDKDAIWAAVLDPNTPAEYRRTIKVKTFKALFDAPADLPDQQIMALVLDFERGLDAVELNPDQVEVQAVLRLPLSDYILRRAEEGQYRYKMTIIRRKGQQRDADWRVDNTGILFPDVG